MIRGGKCLTISLCLVVAACGSSTSGPPVKPAAATTPTVTMSVSQLPQEPDDLTPDAFFSATSKSVVLVNNPDASLMGSGVEIRSGVFVTNCHVLEGGSRYFVERLKVNYSVLLIRSDAYHDICLLQGDAGVPHPVATRSAMDVRVGERVYAIGNPQGFELTLSEGLVSQLRHANTSQIEPYIQTTAAISQGSSGGGLFDSKGRLIGISSFMWREGQNLNFAAPVDWALALDAGKAALAESTNKAVASIPTAEEMNAEAIELIKANKTSDAIALLERAASLAPTNAEIAGNLGYAYVLTSKFAEAKEVLLGALKLDPKRASTWLNLGQTYAELGDNDAAVRSVVNGYKLSSKKQKIRDALSRVPFDESASALWRQAADGSLAAIDGTPPEH